MGNIGPIRRRYEVLPVREPLRPSVPAGRLPVRAEHSDGEDTRPPRESRSGTRGNARG